MKMTPLVVLFGSTLILFSVVIANIIMPWFLVGAKPTPNTTPYTPLELRGREIYIANGCVYCHTQNVRPMDWGGGSGEASQPGDYAYDSPNLFGQHRTGPDLAREGGYHPDDWQWAHLQDPRYVRPQSIMPSFKFVTGEDRVALIAYLQCLGGRICQQRAAEQRRLKRTLIKYYNLGPAQNVAYLNSTLPKGWLEMPNPEPVDEGAIERGRAVYVAYCIGCHGANGDGRGAAKPYLNPPPMDFTLVQASGANPSSAEPGYRFNYKANQVSVLNNGAIYYAVLNGLPGSAMPAFKGQLESEKIWDVGDYVGWAFMGWKKQPIQGDYQEISEKPAHPRGVLAVGGASPGAHSRRV